MFKNSPSHHQSSLSHKEPAGQNIDGHKAEMVRKKR